METIPTPTEQHANCVTNESILKLLQNLQSKVENITKENQNLKKDNPPMTDLNINPKNGKLFKRYWYSCGCCTRWGMNFTNKKSGHKDDTTF